MPLLINAVLHGCVAFYLFPPTIATMGDVVNGSPAITGVLPKMEKTTTNVASSGQPNTAFCCCYISHFSSFSDTQ
jgi:hypothetical protein